MSSTQNTNVWTREKLTDAPLVQAPNIMNNTELSKLIEKFHEAWAVANGYRPQAPSLTGLKLQAASIKPQATSLKLKAASHKLHDP